MRPPSARSSRRCARTCPDLAVTAAPRGAAAILVRVLDGPTSATMIDLQPVVDQGLAEFARAAALAELEDAKACFLGKSGRITEQLKALAALPADEKKARGAAINVAKQAIE